MRERERAPSVGWGVRVGRNRVGGRSGLLAETRLDPRTLGWRPQLKADTQPTESPRHPQSEFLIHIRTYDFAYSEKFLLFSVLRALTFNVIVVIF